VGRSIDRSGVIGAKKWVFFDAGTFRPVPASAGSRVCNLGEKGAEKRKLANEKTRKKGGEIR
jgi:hypothetical protein